MRRRTLMAGATLLALAACAEVAGPPDFSFGGQGFQIDNTRLNLAYAERNLGDMSRFRGKPAEAAAALAQFEAAVSGMRNPGNNITVTQIEAELITKAIRVEREALGIPLAIPPGEVAAALANAVPPLVSGDRGAIQAALSNHIFTFGPAETLARLSNLPPMPELESVAPLLATSAASEWNPGGTFIVPHRR